jgi:hypothetical protein
MSRSRLGYLLSVRKTGMRYVDERAFVAGRRVPARSAPRVGEFWAGRSGSNWWPELVKIDAYRAASVYAVPEGRTV